MGKTLKDIAKQLEIGIAEETKKKVAEELEKEIAKKLKNEMTKKLEKKDGKVKLIYGFNGVGKTRLSREFNDLIATRTEKGEDHPIKILYYNAFTEDLFYWDNDLEGGTNLELKIHPNLFTQWIFEEEGKENSIKIFQGYVGEDVTPKFVPGYKGVKFYFKKGTRLSENADNGIRIKISKGEESLFIWSVFYSLLEQVISTLDESNKQKPTELDKQKPTKFDKQKSTKFGKLKYVFIDDPVSSLDEEHLIQVAVDLAKLIKSSKFEDNKLKFIITTHNPLFYNVLYNEFGKNLRCYLLEKFEDGTFNLEEKSGDSNKSFSYHLHLKQILENATKRNKNDKNDKIERYHFTLLRNLYEKTASFLGYEKWTELLPGKKESYYRRIITFTSHSTLSNEPVAVPTPEEKKIIRYLLNHLIENYSYFQKKRVTDEGEVTNKGGVADEKGEKYD